MIPTQEKEHKKKCLLPDGAGSPPTPRQARLAVVQGRGEGRKRPVGQRKRKNKGQRRKQQRLQQQQVHFKTFLPAA